MKNINSYFLALISLILLYSCGPTSKMKVVAVIEKPMLVSNIEGDYIKKNKIEEEDFREWYHKDLFLDTVIGMSIDRAYSEILDSLPSKTIIVAVLDSGVDINHEDLKDVIWTNEDEIPNNGIDDDKNNYIDDVHGWNFLGEIGKETMELTRIVREKDTSFNLEELNDIYETKVTEIQQNLSYIKDTEVKLNKLDSFLTKELGKGYTFEDFEKYIETKDPEKDKEIFELVGPVLGYRILPDDFREEILGAKEYYQTQFDYHYNLQFDGRKILGDDANDFSKTVYGNNNVIGPNIDDAFHGTHVSGIIAAKRNNDIGINGIADNVKIMVVRTVPDGDEYDKDVYSAIKYAVDNGAKVINTSFGKGYSTYSEKVQEAIKYAASKDVLIVNAAGNDAKNIDENATYPTDNVDGIEIANNFITIGASTDTYSSHILAGFSNYGKENVDLFAPGNQIWSTIPENKYDFASGTSMAAPNVAGVAVLIRSRFPSLKAEQVKKILMQSGLPYNGNVDIMIQEDNDHGGGDSQNSSVSSHGGNKLKSEKFSNISKSGKIVNLYNAIILASRVANRKVSLD